MRQRCAAALVVALAALCAAAVAQGDGSAAAKTTRGKVTVRKSAYGTVIFDGRGRALYIFTADSRRKSRCYGACARAWPPFLTRGKPRAGAGTHASLIGTTRRRDGTTQATYRGRPLYYYVGDRQAGQILCQDVEEFGGHWYVIRPRGTAVR